MIFTNLSLQIFTLKEYEHKDNRKNCTCHTDQITFTNAIVQSLTTATLQNVEYRKPLSLGRTLDNLGKDIRTVASGVVGARDSAEVYAVSGKTRFSEVRQVDSGND